MNLYVAAIALTILANLGYHLLQRSIRPDLSPLISLIATYGTALLVCLIALPVFRGEEPLGQQLAKLGWPSVTLGLAIIALELGFLLAYRAGWDLSVAALYSNAAVALLLLPVGVLAFHEGMDARKVAGLVCAFVGLILLSSKPVTEAV
jgi:drug/metabolite transporter (DMT)-like permease